MQDVGALEVTLGGDVEITLGDSAQLLTEHRSHFIGRPDEELALFALAIRVLSRVEAALGTGHLAQYVVENLARHRQELGLAERAAGVEIEPRQQRVVVEHLLEVWHQPSVVNTVAMESAAELVVDAALGHPGQRLTYHVAEFEIA